MLTIEPTGAVLGATARGIDLAQPLGERDFAQILLALGRHGVLRFPGQRPRPTTSRNSGSTCAATGAANARR